MCDIDNSDLKHKIDDIYNAVTGKGLHLDNGILQRLERIERWKSKQAKRSGVISGISMVVGFVISKLIKLW